MKKFLLKNEYFPKNDENLMNNVGNVKLARENFLEKRPSNLDFLLNKRFEWMNTHIGSSMKGIEVGCGHGLSKEYIKKFGVPKTVDELDYHKIIAYGETAQPPLNRNRLNWLLNIGREKNNIRKLSKLII